MASTSNVIRYPSVATTDQATADSFQNFRAKLGRNTGNLNDGGTYGFNPISRLRMLIEWAYRGSWVVGKAVDSVAEDLTREGVTVLSSDDPKQIKLLEREVRRLGCWKQLTQTLKWARLYGGALGYLMIDGQDPSTPLRLETVGLGQFRGIFPMDRWLVMPSYNMLVTDYGPDFGKPQFYDTQTDVTSGLTAMHIHHTRMMRFDGLDLPYFQRQSENFWGLSILERIWDRLIIFDSGTTGAAQLLFKAHLRTYKVEGLREIIAMGGTALDGLVKQIDMIRALQSNEGITLMDSKDEFETHQYAFAGLDSVLEQFGSQLCGALGIPRTRFFGESPGGLGSSGASELRTYYDELRQKQETDLDGPVETVYRLTYRSRFGKDAPEDFECDWNPLWQSTDSENADVVQKTAGTIMEAFKSQVIDRATAMLELKALAGKTGVFTNIQDSDIAQAALDPEPSPEALGLELPAKPDPTKPGAAPSATKKPDQDGAR